MTTIACNRKMMAADSLCTDENTKSKGLKIHRVRGSIIGFAGEYQAGSAFISWFKKPSDDRPAIEDFQALVLQDGKIFMYESLLIPIPVLDPFVAIGSGRDAALAAMMCGKDPKEAVKIACKVDTYSGLPVRCLTL